MAKTIEYINNLIKLLLTLSSGKTYKLPFKEQEKTAFLHNYLAITLTAPTKASQRHFEIGWRSLNTKWNIMLRSIPWVPVTQIGLHDAKLVIRMLEASHFAPDNVHRMCWI